MRGYQRPSAERERHYKCNTETEFKRDYTDFNERDWISRCFFMRNKRAINKRNERDGLKDRERPFREINKSNVSQERHY